MILNIINMVCAIVKLNMGCKSNDVVMEFGVMENPNWTSNLLVYNERFGREHKDIH